MKVIYARSCPICRGDISDEELLTNCVCSKCAPSGLKSPADLLERKRKKTGYFRVLEMQLELERFIEFFKRLHRVSPWSLQEVWAKRVLLRHSFSIVAPTGMGKTTFGLTMALFLLMRGYRSYILVPSGLLVQHLLDKVREFCERGQAGLLEKVVGYYSGMRASDSEEALRRIEGGRFKILITTDRFLYNKFDVISKYKFDFVFVDDVDSFLKSPKNIDKSMILLGFDKSTVDDALRILSMRRKRRLGEKELSDLVELEEKVRGSHSQTKGILVISGATLRGRLTTRVRLFRYLLGFEPGFRPEFLRNVLNVYMEPRGSVEEEVIELVRRHGRGCLIYVPQARGVEFASRLEAALKDSRIPCILYQRMHPRLLERFVRGEVSALIGVASSRGPLVRGIDLPEHVRYVIFAGVPRRELKVSKNECNPSLILALLRSLAILLMERHGPELSKHIATLSKIVPLNNNVLQRVRLALNNGESLEGFEGYVLRSVRDAMDFVERTISEVEQSDLSDRVDVSVKVTDDGYSLIIPDEIGYLQASGRASRLFAGGLSRGIAITIVDDRKAYHGLAKRLQVMTDEDFVQYDSKAVEEEFRRVDEDRERISRIREGLIVPEQAEVMKSSLIVVESPTKSHTIASMFGRPARRDLGGLTVYESSSGDMIVSVVATQGHVVDLSTTHGFHGVMDDNDQYVPFYTDIRRCNRCREQFTDFETCPACGSKNLTSKRSVIESLRTLAVESDLVLLATDPDSEGEKIAYDAYCLLYPYNRNIMRLEFHEVTRRAIRAALASPTQIKTSLVDAQIVRRIEDRWVGFELSRRLWEKFGRKTLSAGRVQTPVLGWVVRQIDESKKRRQLLHAVLSDGTKLEFTDLQLDLGPIRKKFEEGNLTVDIKEIELREDLVNPPPPFTTDSLLKTAANYLGFRVNYTMRLAQTLFESGLITYHRTDSTTVSSTGIAVARQYLEESDRLAYFQPRTWKSEGAHECIRPTRPIDAKQLEVYLNTGLLRTVAPVGRDESRLYDLIFKRFISSQMAPARVQVQVSSARLDGLDRLIERTVRVIEPGFLSFTPFIKESQPLLPGTYKVIEMSVKRVPAAWPFREGDVISLMKERGIGRPSTYSKIVKVLFDRGYVFENAGRLIPTKLGRQVYEYLATNYSSMVSEELTRQLEETMDSLERGELDYQSVLKSLHKEITLIAKCPLKE
ncbi:MAG: reverse gyrase [Aigarchaeota archaeon]|nr:reverse gyrase [Aigarchaeota archaeon]MDW8092122.1 reverse gyrase [Nitrososphaerota archaeon]